MLRREPGLLATESLHAFGGIHGELEEILHFLALAADFDGTLAHHGSIAPETVQALNLLKETGRRLVLVTGREMSDLKHTFPGLELFDRIVAENGGVIHDPVTGREHALAPAPPVAFVQKLMERQVEPISVGRTIVATWHPHHMAVLDAIEELGLELQIIFNKGAVMVLPAGLNKGTGLKAALEELGMSPVNVVAVGDAENDHAFLKICGCSAAVANALPAVKEACDIRLSRDHGAGVAELIERIIREDARLLPPSRHGVLVGVDRDGEEAYLQPHEAVLVAGGSGTGKSSFATLFTERLIEKQLEFCVIDPEGDYEDLDHAVPIGDDSIPISVAEVVRLLRTTGLNLVINTVAVDLPDRRRFFEDLLPSVLDVRAATGRPHWLIIDEAHHFVPRSDAAASDGLAQKLAGIILVTVDPKWLPTEVLQRIDVLLAFGDAASTAVAAFAEEAGLQKPVMPKLAPNEAVYWSRELPGGCRAVKIGDATQTHERHKGKYAMGDVGEEHSFYFRGKTDDCVRRACNLAEFICAADEVGDDVWEEHLLSGDVTSWFRDVIQDEELARRATEVASDRALNAHESRRRIQDAIHGRYVITDRNGQTSSSSWSHKSPAPRNSEGSRK